MKAATVKFNIEVRQHSWNEGFEITEKSKPYFAFDSCDSPFCYLQKWLLPGNSTYHLLWQQWLLYCHQYTPVICSFPDTLGLLTEVLGKRNPLSWGDTIWGLTDVNCCVGSKVKISLHALWSPRCGPSTSCRFREAKNFFRRVFGTREVSWGGRGGGSLIFKTHWPLIKVMFPSPPHLPSDLLILRVASKAIHNSSFSFLFFF